MASEFLAQVAPLLGAVCGAGFTLFLTRYQLRHSNEIARKEKWREALAQHLAEFSGKCYSLILSFSASNSRNSELELKTCEELASARMKVFLMLDPNQIEHKALIEAMNETVKYLFNSKREENKISDHMTKVLACARVFTSESSD